MDGFRDDSLNKLAEQIAALDLVIKALAAVREKLDAAWSTPRDYRMDYHCRLLERTTSLN